MRHFETKREAIKFKESKGGKVFRKLKGHLNRVKKPFVVGSEFEWLNLS